LRLNFFDFYLINAFLNKDDIVNGSFIKSYSNRGGRTTEAQKRALSDLAPLFVVPFSGELLDCQKIFSNDNALSTDNALSNDKDLVVEIGFGMGVATAMIAEKTLR
jgi:tRNA (guanine-N7-)-methyltransferase